MKKVRIQAAQSLIEFALLIPMVFLLIMGLFDTGRAIFYYAMMNSAAREGTRLAIVQPDCDYRSNPDDCSGGYLDAYPLICENAQSSANIRICNRVEAMLFNINELSPSSITINHFTSNTDSPVISVEINYNFKPITPGIALIGDLTLNAHSQMLKSPIALP